MVDKCTFMLKKSTKLNSDKPAPESALLANASQIHGSISPFSFMASIKKQKRFKDIPHEKLITIAELLK